VRQGQNWRIVQHGAAFFFPKRPGRFALLGCLWVGMACTAWRLAVPATAPQEGWRPGGGGIENRAAPAPRTSEAIDRELFAPEPKPTQPSDPKTEPQRVVTLEAIVEQMVQCARRLGEIDSGPGTQQLQHRIVEDLEAILRQVGKDPSDAAGPRQKIATKPETEAKPQTPDGERKAASAKPGVQPEPGQTADHAKGPEAQAESPANRSSLLRRVWGDLPVRQRDEILQFQPPDEFLPEYEAEIEAYFRRLAAGSEKTRWGAKAEREEK